MIWEADEDLDGSIEWHEFKSCYARSLVDKHGLEPNQLYHFIQFLLCDTDGSYTVSGTKCMRIERRTHFSSPPTISSLRNPEQYWS